jgi:hypothetical protein
MNTTVQELKVRQNATLKEMHLIQSMRCGTINEQYFKTLLKRKRRLSFRIPIMFYYDRKKKRPSVSTSSQGRTGAGQKGCYCKQEIYNSFLEVRAISAEVE